MLNRIETGIAAVLTAVLASPAAFAGSVTNTWTNGSSHGHQTVKVNNIRVEHGDFNRETQNFKVEALTEPGGFAEASVNFDGHKFTGNGYANITRGIDPVVKSGFSKNRETGGFNDITTTEVNSFNRTQETFNSHTLNADW